MNERNKKIYTCAYNYLLSSNKVNKRIVDAHIDINNYPRPTELNELCKKMIHHAKNTSWLKNPIGDIERFRSYLHNFKPKQIQDECNRWEDVFKLILESGKVDVTKMCIEKNQNSWVKISKSIFTITKFLSKYDSAECFYSEIDNMYNNEELKYELPSWLYVNNNIYGYKFALACDFLKEIGYSDYIKPDKHIKEIFEGIGICSSNEDKKIFFDVIDFANSINETPFKVDKVFWLIGSGNFYFNNIKVSYSKDNFINIVKSIV